MATIEIHVNGVDQGTLDFGTGKAEVSIQTAKGEKTFIRLDTDEEAFLNVVNADADYTDNV